MRPVDLSEFAQNLLAMHDRCQELLGSSPLRADAKLLLFVASRKSPSIKDAMHTCSLSNRSFYQMIDRLKSEGKIAIVSDEQDRRVHRIIPGPSLREVPTAVKTLVAALGCSNNECFLKQPGLETAAHRLF